MKESRKSILLAFLVGVTASIVGKLVLDAATKARGIKFPVEVLSLFLLTSILGLMILVYLMRFDRSLKKRIDLLFRMSYQGPFVLQIKAEQSEKDLYCASVLRKLDSLSEYKKVYGDTAFCSYYIGCLAFLANEKRADIPWEKFQDKMVATFADEILKEEIDPHVINDHYKNHWNDLLEAAKKYKSAHR